MMFFFICFETSRPPAPVVFPLAFARPYAKWKVERHRRALGQMMRALAKGGYFPSAVTAAVEASKKLERGAAGAGRDAGMQATLLAVLGARLMAHDGFWGTNLKAGLVLSWLIERATNGRVRLPHQVAFYGGDGTPSADGAAYAGLFKGGACGHPRINNDFMKKYEITRGDIKSLFMDAPLDIKADAAAGEALLGLASIITAPKQEPKQEAPVEEAAPAYAKPPPSIGGEVVLSGASPVAEAVKREAATVLHLFRGGGPVIDGRHAGNIKGELLAPEQGDVGEGAEECGLPSKMVALSPAAAGDAASPIRPVVLDPVFIRLHFGAAFLLKGARETSSLASAFGDMAQLLNSTDASLQEHALSRCSSILAELFSSHASDVGTNVDESDDDGHLLDVPGASDNDLVMADGFLSWESYDG